MTSITTFTGAISAGLARPNRFKVILPGDNQGSVGILCYQCTFPQRSLKTFDVMQRGVPYRVPFSQDYSPVSFNFYALPDYNTRQYFDEWHKDVILSLPMNVMGTYDRYVKNIKIQSLDRMGQVKYKIKLYEAWPVTIGDVDLNYSSNTYQSIAVTLSYKYWKEE